MMNYEEDDRAATLTWPVYPLAYSLTCEEAIAEARRQLCALGWGCQASDAQIVAKVRSDCTLFTGADNPIRLAIFGTTQCPTTAQACGAGQGINTTTMLLIGVAAALAVGVVIVAARPATKKVVVARVER